MMKLYDLGNNLFKIETSNFGSRQGSLRDVVQFAVFDLDIEWSDLELALEEMAKKGHDAADFGIFGGFVFSFSTKEQKNVG